MSTKLRIFNALTAAGTNIRGFLVFISSVHQTEDIYERSVYMSYRDITKTAKPFFHCSDERLGHILCLIVRSFELP